MKWPKRALIALAALLTALLVVAAALPFLFSFDDYIPRFEKAASDAIAQPVTIKSVRFAALPLPHVTMDGIIVGNGDIKLGKVRVTPGLLSLLRSTTVIRNIEIDSLVLTLAEFNRMLAQSKADAPGSRPAQHKLRFEKISLTGARIALAKSSFGPFDADLSLDAGGVLREASITTKDGRLKSFISPDNGKYRIDADAKSWALPIGMALAFDDLHIKGVATADEANLEQVSARLYGGTINGKTNVSWRKVLQLSGSFEVVQVELREISAMLSSRTGITGRLNAKPVWSVSAASADQLVHSLRLETPFSIQNGVIHGVDIQKAATVLVKQGATGGETRFEQLSGHMVLEHGAYHFTQLKIASGSLVVDGDVNVSARKELSGRVNAQIKLAGASATVPLNVTGTIDEPLLYPTAATVAGAAVGTALMGPGIGTAVGAKIGGWAEGIFGSKDEPKSRK